MAHEKEHHYIKQELVDLHDDRSEVAEVRLRGALVEVLPKGRFQLRLMVDDRLLQLPELFHAPVHVQRHAGAEEPALLFYNLMYSLLRIAHFDIPYKKHSLPRGQAGRFSMAAVKALDVVVLPMPISPETSRR